MANQLEVYSYDQDPYYVIVGDTTVVVHRGAPPGDNAAPPPAAPAEPVPVFAPHDNPPVWSALVANLSDAAPYAAAAEWVGDFVRTHPDHQLQLIVPTDALSTDRDPASMHRLIATVERLASQYPAVSVNQLRGTEHDE